MFEMELDWDRPARNGALPTTHILRVRLKPLASADRPNTSLPLRLAVALDISGSMAGAKLDGAIAACRAILSLLRPEDRLSLAAFGDALHILLNTVPGDAQALAAGEAAFTSLRPLGVTRTDLALDWLTLALPPASGALAIALLITDGHPTDAQGHPLSSVVPLLAQATNLADQGVTLCTIGLGSAADFNTGFLVDLSDRGRGVFLYAANPEGLEAQLRERLHRAHSVAVTESRLLLRPLVPGVRVETACRLRPEFLPLSAPEGEETLALALPALPGDTPTDLLLSVTVPPPGFGEPLGVQEVLEVRLAADDAPVCAIASITSTASYREAQQLHAEVDQDRLHWEMNTYSTALSRTTNSRRTSALLSDLASTARRSGRTDLAARAEQELSNLQATGSLNPHNAAVLLTSTREREEA